MSFPELTEERKKFMCSLAETVTQEETRLKT